MNRRAFVLCLIGWILPLACASAQESGAIGCEAFHWNVTRELAVMREPAIAVSATSREWNSAVQLKIARHYAVTLAPQDEVRYAVPLARPAKAPAAQGGSLRFTVASAGRYRVSISTRHWLDVISAGKPIDSRDHEGHEGCQPLHKVVEFDLPARQPLILQLSGGEEKVVGLAITRVSPGE